MPGREAAVRLLIGQVLVTAGEGTVAAPCKRRLGAGENGRWDRGCGGEERAKGDMEVSVWVTERTVVPLTQLGTWRRGDISLESCEENTYGG